ncbi:MAG: IS200/IS605 family transposase [Anaerolineales bacterium]|nr:IS200/IS605 family transposase [Anaerolineales bacterium]
MAKNLLFVTNDARFINGMRHGIEQAGYSLYIAKRKSEAIILTDEEKCSLAFLDLDIGERFVAEIGSAIRTINPTINLILFSDEDTPPALDEIRPWILLRKPKHLPEMLNMLNDKAFQQPKKPQASEASHAVQLNNKDELSWLGDVTKAAQHLTRLTLESSAQAALITRKNNLWAYAGQLSQDAARELAVTVTRHWDGQKGSDLLRFVRLEATKAEHMLYATRLADDVVLALVFDAETPFSTIRMQAGQLVNRLSSPGLTEAMEPHIEQQNQAPVAYEAQAPSVEEDEDTSDDVDIPNIANILNDVPPPIPSPRTHTPMESAGTRTSIARPKKDNRESSPVVHQMEESPVDNDQTVEHVVEDIDATMPSKSRKRPETPMRRPATGELDETRPHSITEVAGRVMLEPITPGLYNLTYACLLVPRLTNHYLTGDISDRLSEWLPQICIAFGWRLEYLAVRPEYVQWVVNVPPAASPGYLMRIMRQQTSEKIFSEFSRLKKENPSGDFWAPGYLIMGGTQPHPPQLVKDYIKQTRVRQGIEQGKH